MIPVFSTIFEKNKAIPKNVISEIRNPNIEIRNKFEYPMFQIIKQNNLNPALKRTKR